MPRLTSNLRIKVYSEDDQKIPIGFAVSGEVMLTGAFDLQNVLGRYTRVLAFHAEEPSPLRPGALVLGDGDDNVYLFKSTGDFTVNPEQDKTFNGFAESDNWINITLRQHLQSSIDNKVPFLWNPDAALRLVHPASMFGSDGNLYDSVNNGDLTDDPTNGNNQNWIQFLDPSKGIIPTGLIKHWPTKVVPFGWLLCDGTSIDKAVFADLYDVLKDGTNECIYGESGLQFRTS